MDLVVKPHFSAKILHIVPLNWDDLEWENFIWVDDL